MQLVIIGVWLGITDKPMTRNETLQHAAEIFAAMDGADIPTVARLAHALHDLAELGHLQDVAEASTDVERMAASHKPMSLTGPLNRLSAALGAAAERHAA